MHDSLMQLWYGFGVALEPANLMWSVFGVLVFHFGLHVLLPLWAWE